MTEELRERYGIDLGAALRELERDGDLVLGEFRPGGSEREWCDLGGAAAAPPGVAGRAAQGDRACRPARACAPPARVAGRRPPSARRRRRRPPARCAGPAAGAYAAGRGLGAGGAAAPHRRVLEDLARQLSASREVVWLGAGALGRSGRVALYFREDAAASGRPPGRRPATSRPAAARACANGLRAAPASSPTCWPSSRPPCRGSCARRCGTSSGPARSPTTRWRRCGRRGCRWHGRAGRLEPSRARAALAASRRAGAARRRLPGPGPLVAHRPLFARVPRSTRLASAGARWPSCCSSATGS